MGKRTAKRTRKRIPCEIEIQGQRHTGIVLDLSATGLFVQTTATPNPGAHVSVRLKPAGGEPVEVAGRIARRRYVPGHLSQLSQSGIGVRLESPPGAYHAIYGQEAGPKKKAAPRSGGIAPAAGDSPGRSTAEKKSARPGGPAAPAADGAQGGSRRFRVRVSQTEGTRCRAYVVACASEEQARERALRAAGEGWSVDGVEVA